jgi:hypothetical protein
MAEALLGVDVLPPLAPYRPPLPLPVVVEEPHATMKSARARPTAKKRAFLECFMCWILLCCFPRSLRGYKHAEVGHHEALEERNAELCCCRHASLHNYTQKGYTYHRQSACSSENTSACAKSILRCWVSSPARLGEGRGRKRVPTKESRNGDGVDGQFLGVSLSTLLPQDLSGNGDAPSTLESR